MNEITELKRSLIDTMRENDVLKQQIKQHVKNHVITGDKQINTDN